MKRTILLVLAVVLWGCSGHGRKSSQSSSELRLEDLSDPSGLNQGGPVLTKVEPYRMANGVLRIRGTIDFPDGARIQVSIYRTNTNQMLNRLQMIVHDHHFDSPPIIGPGGPLPTADYRLEYLAHFNDTWQPASVLRATDQGRRLRGPGVTRDRLGQGAFYLVEERSL